MSLLVWIPMVHGDCKDQGLLGVETSVINTVTYVDGKLGKAAQIGNGNQVTNGIQINTNLVEELGTQYSCSVWIKPLGNHVHYEGAIISSGNWNNKCWAFGVNQDNTAVDVFCGRYSRNVTCPVPVNEWTHLVSVNDGTYTHLYKNGELISTVTTSSWPLSSDATITTVGRESYAGGYFSFNGCIQDLRIYDHALSPREVKEISKGLVLHYPLNREGFGADNICKNKDVDLSSSDFGSYSTRSYDTENHIGKIQVTDTSHRWNAWKFGPSDLDTTCQELTTGTNTYTVSVDIRVTNYTTGSIACAFDFRTSNIVSASALTLLTVEQCDGNWHRVSCSLTTNDTQNNSCLWCIHSNGSTHGSQTTIEYKNWKLERGSKATPWIPHKTDELYSKMGLDNNVEYDVSGYGHNGVKAGDITYVEDTPRYNVCAKINSNTSFIMISGLTTSGFGNSYSIAWWGNVADYSNKMMWGFADGIRLNGVYNGTLWNTGDGSNNPIYKPGTTTRVSTPTGNVWHHFVMTGDGAANYLYIDGVLYGQSKVYKPISGTTIYINGWSSGTSYRYLSNFKISDFRIYATALSADDVLELYHTPVTLSNNGTLLTQGEYVEV